jgi:coatomer protein complex subunit gamma
LRDEGGYEYKRAIVEAIFDIVHSIPESKEYAFAHLCEFIEDCEFTKLAVRILHLLGTEGPHTSTPSKYIRYIYNRVILENSTVRAAAVSALARFAVHLPEMRERIKVLLNRCLDDNDDEVRDRAAFYLRLLESESSSKYIDLDVNYVWPSLEHNLLKYLDAETSKPFDIKVVPLVSKAQEDAERMRIKTALQESTAIPTLKSPTSASITPTKKFDTQQAFADELATIPELAQCGALFKTSKPVQLTENETEYVVHCIKHVFAEYIVFQFKCRNTLNDSLLENVSVAMRIESTEDDDALSMQQVFSIPAARLAYDDPQTVFVGFKRRATSTPTATFSCTLKFLVKDCDPNTGEPDEEGFDDEYSLEELELSMSDYISSTFVSDFAKAWEDLGDENEQVETYALTAVPSIKAAVVNVVQMLGMNPVGDVAVKDGQSTFVLSLAGLWVGGIPVLARCRMVCIFCFSLEAL